MDVNSSCPANHALPTPSAEAPPSVYSYLAARLPLVALLVLALRALQRLREEDSPPRLALPARLGLGLLALALAAPALLLPDAHPLSPRALQGALGGALLLPLAPAAAVLPGALLAALRALGALAAACARCCALALLLSWGYCAALGAAGLAHSQALRCLASLPCALRLRLLLAAPLATAAAWRSLRMAALALLPDLCLLACAGGAAALHAGRCGGRPRGQQQLERARWAEPLAALALFAAGLRGLAADAGALEWGLVLGGWGVELAAGRALERGAARAWDAASRDELVEAAGWAAEELQRRWPWRVADVLRLCLGRAGQRRL